MTAANWTITEIVLVASAVGGAIAWLIKLHTDRRKDNAELGKIDIESWKLLREQVGEMEEKIVQLRDRVEVLEAEKDETLKKFNELKAWVRGLLRQLDTAGVQYTPPPPGLLDTDPRIPKVGK